MWQLLKQVFKSFKSSILLLFGLIFISTTIVFSSFSSFTLFKNISESKSYLDSKGNFNDAILTRDYKDSEIFYKISEQTNKEHWVLDETALDYKKPDENNQQPINMVFPYSNATFTNPKINSEPFTYRSKGMILAYGAYENGEAYKISDLSNNSMWASMSLGFSFTHPNTPTTSATQPNEYIYEEINVDGDPNNKKVILTSSYNIHDKEIRNNINFVGLYASSNKAVFDTTKTLNHDLNHFNSVTANLTFLDSPYIRTQPISKHTNREILNYTYVGEYLNFLEQKDANITNSSDPYLFLKKESHPTYTLTIDEEQLSPLDKKVFALLKTEKEELEAKGKFGISALDDINNVDVLIKNSWINSNGSNSEEIKNSILEKKIKDLSLKAIEVFRSKYDEVISSELNDLLIDNKIKSRFGEQNQFIIQDNESSNKYIIAEKGQTNIDDIVYTSGTKLNNSAKYLDQYSFEQLKKNIFTLERNPGYGNKYFPNYIKYLNDSYPLSNSIYPSFIQDWLREMVDNINFSRPIDNEKYNYLMAYFLPNYDFINDINSNFHNNKQGASFSLLRKGGLTTTSIDDNIINFDRNSFSITVTEEFLNRNNKKILPNEEWLKTSKLNSLEFHSWLTNLNEQYYITINSNKYVILSTGLSPEMAFPSISIDSPIPNLEKESVIYTTKGGYNSILFSTPHTYQYKYFNIDLGTFWNKSEIIKKINNHFNQYGLSSYSLSDSSVNNILTMRRKNAELVQIIVFFVALIIIIVLILLGLYLSYLLIKGYISKNQVQLAIIKANGFSSFSITLAISSFGLICSVIAGLFGYLIAYFMQSLFFELISPYWFIKTVFSNFSFPLLLMGILILLTAFILFTFIIIRLTFRKPINQLISENVEIKPTKLLNILKTPSHKINPLFKFRIALSISNVWRTIFFIVLYSISLSTIAVGLTVGDKFYSSQHLTSQNYDYGYKFSFENPTEQSGLYKIQEYSQLGFSDLDQGLIPLYSAKNKSNSDSGFIYKGKKYTWETSPFGYPYDMSDLIILDPETGKPKLYDDIVDGELIKGYRYLGNLLLPSYQAYQSMMHNPDFFHNSVFTKWFMDFEIPGLNLNAWKLVRGMLPAEIVSRAESQDQVFLKALYDHNFLGDEAKKYINYNSSTNEYEIMPEKVIKLGKPDEIGFNKSFLTFICKVYGDEYLSNLDVKMSFGIIPYDKNSSETFTEVDAKIYKNNKLLSESEKVTGIKENSKFIKLKDNKLNDIQNKLFQNNLKDNVQPLIINNGIAYKYNLDISDRITLKSNKDYFRFSTSQFNLYKKEENQNIETPSLNNEIEFEIVDISSDSFGNEIYMSQENANKLNMLLPDYKNHWNGAMYQSNIKLDINDNNQYSTDFQINYLLPNEKVFDSRSELTPFNGIIFDDKSTPFFLKNAVSFQSTLGVWNLYNYANKNELISKLDQWKIYRYYSYAPFIKNQNLLNSMGFENYNDYWNNYIKTKYNSIDLYLNFLIDIYDTKPVNMVINNIYIDEIVGKLYGNLIDTISLVQQMSISIITPLIIVMVLVISAAMLAEFERIIIVLKTIGYGDKKNIFSILCTFIPIIIISSLLSVLILWSILAILQLIIYQLSSIFITNSINFIYYLYGFLALLGILILNFIFMIFKYKTQKLKTAILD